MEDEARYGYCRCGCGQRTPLALKTDRHYGYVKGEPHRWIVGHTSRKAIRYLINPVTGCWDWQLYVGPDGYGNVCFQGRSRGAHIVMYEMKYGPKPLGLEMDHLCRNRSCVNPDHLEPVTPAVNVRRSPRTKLDESQVHKIRRLAMEGMSYRALGRMFKVSYTHIGAVCTRRVWQEI